MLDIISSGFKDAALKLKGQARLSDANIEVALEAVHKSLLDADVDLDVVKTFIKGVRERTLGNIVTLKSKTGGQVAPQDHFIKACYDELVSLLGGEQQELIKASHGPTILLLVGLQGAGKTTLSAKIAHLLKGDKKYLNPLLVACDVYRPAAREQLKILGERIQVPVFTKDTQNPIEIAQEALELAKSNNHDLVIIDTAGRLAIDQKLMEELSSLKRTVHAENIIFVVDAMIGQDAVKTALEFDKLLGLTGFVITKLDGDARGGSALSLRQVTGKSVLFMGTGEGVDRLEIFRPEGMASRILGMGDVVSLMDDFSRKLDTEKAEADAAKFMEGKFDFNSFYSVCDSIGKLGPLGDIMSKMPMMGDVPSSAVNQMEKSNIVNKFRHVIQSMTKYERSHPEALTAKTATARSRVHRITKGAGVDSETVHACLTGFSKMTEMSGLFKTMSAFQGGGGGLLSKIPGLRELNKMASFAKMAKMGGGLGGGMMPPGMGGMPGMEDMSAASSVDLAEINRLRKKKKEEKIKKQKKGKKR